MIDAANSFLAGHLAQPFALLAVGGYGRRELFPFSDVDLLLLLEREPDAALKDPLGLFLRTLWDSSSKPVIQFEQSATAAACRKAISISQPVSSTRASFAALLSCSSPLPVACRSFSVATRASCCAPWRS